ncbi:MAG: sugar transferase [Pseudomonadota bacterium]
MLMRKREQISAFRRRQARTFSPLTDKATGFYREDYFNDLIRRERKRTERSRKPFALVLLGIDGLDRPGEKYKTVREIASVLFSTTRETDIKGWYRNNATIGILFTEFGRAGQSGILEKMADSLKTGIGPGRTKRIAMSCHCFPSTTGKTGIDFRPELYPDLSAKSASTEFSSYTKRILDIAASLSIILFFAPLFPIIAALIKLSSKGPVLFKQERLGFLARKFYCLKFRSMVVNTDAHIHKSYIEKYIKEGKDITASDCTVSDQKLYKIANDPRVTTVGRFLRKTSLDELPQLFNVLKGDISMVGPRPPLAYEWALYDLWHKQRILEAKPGITGLWQVRGRSRTTFDEMVRLDLQYARNRSLWLDLKILLLTPCAMLSCKGAY